MHPPPSIVPLEGASPMFEGEATRSYQAPTAFLAQKSLEKRTMREEAAEAEMPCISASLAGSLSTKTMASRSDR